MAELIQCSCGSAIECARTDVLETVVCPRCGAELALDVTVDGQRARGFLIAVAGPAFPDERMLIPVGCDLTVGSAEGHWLYLLHPSVAGLHCRLRLEADGRLGIVVPRGDAPAEASFQAEVKAGQTLRIGAFQFSYRVVPVSELTAPPAADALSMRPCAPAAPAGPPVRAITGPQTLGRRLRMHRFRLARAMLYVVSVLIGLLYVVEFRAAGLLPAPIAVAAGLLVTAASVWVDSRVSLTAPGWTWSALGLVVLAAGVQFALGHVAPGAALLLAAASIGAIVFVSQQTGLVTVMLAAAPVSILLLAALMFRSDGPMRTAPPTTVAAANAG